MDNYFLDNLKLYINHEMFKKEKEIDNPEESTTRVNNDYEMQTMSGRATGKVKTSKAAEEAIARFYQKKKDAEKKIPRIVSDDVGELG